MEIGEKGMMVASKVLACSSFDLMTKPEELAKIRKEFMERTKDFKFDPIIPEGQLPPVRDTFPIS